MLGTFVVVFRHQSTMAEGYKAIKVLQTAKKQLRSRLRQTLALVPSESLNQQCLLQPLTAVLPSRDALIPWCGGNS